MLKNVQPEDIEDISERTPEYLLTLISKIIAVFLYRLNVPRKEVEAFTDQIKGRNFDKLFDIFEAYDVQETRRTSREEGRTEGKIEYILELLNDIGTVPDNLKEEIQSQTDLDILKTLHKLAAKSGNIEEFQNEAKL